MLTLGMLTVRYESNLLFLLKCIQVELSLNLSATVLRCDVSHTVSNLGCNKSRAFYLHLCVNPG